MRTLDYGNNGIFLIMGNAGFISSTLNPKPNRSLKGTLTGTLVDPFTGTLGFISSTVVLPGRRSDLAFFSRNTVHRRIF